MLVSCVQQSESVMHIYIYIYLHSLDSFRIWSSFRKLLKVRTCPIFSSFFLLSVFQQSLAVKG